MSVESEGEQGEEGEEEETGVRFRVEEEAGPEGDKMRLHRRDTPHHLKNKRINSQPVRERSVLIYKANLLFLDLSSRRCRVAVEVKDYLYGVYKPLSGSHVQ